MTFEELRAKAKKNAADRTKAAGQKPLGTSLRNYETGIDTTRTSYPSPPKKTAAVSPSTPKKASKSTDAPEKKREAAMENTASRFTLDPKLARITLPETVRVRNGVRRGGEQTTTEIPTNFGRTKSILSGIKDNTAASLAGAAGLALEAKARTEQSAEQLHQNAVRLLENQLALARGTRADGTPLTSLDRKRLSDEIQSAKDLRKQSAAAVSAPVESRIMDASDRMYHTGSGFRKRGEAAMEQAKSGLNPVSRFGVDVAAGAGQMAVDIGAAALSGGSALAPLFARSAGSAALSGKEAGADFSSRAAYAAGSGALSVLVSKISNTPGFMEAHFGQGLAQKIAGSRFFSNLVSRLGQNGAVEAVGRMAGTAAGRTALAALGEGTEGLAENIGQTFLQKATVNPDADFDPVQAGYDFLLRGTLGGLVSAAEHMPRRTSGSTETVSDGTGQNAGESPSALSVRPVQRDSGPKTDRAASNDIFMRAAEEFGRRQAERQYGAGILKQTAERGSSRDPRSSAEMWLQDIADGDPDYTAPKTSSFSPEQLLKLMRDTGKGKASQTAPVQKTQQAPAPVDLDALLKSRVRQDFEQFSPDAQKAIEDAYEQGTVGMDAMGKIFRVVPENHIDQREITEVGPRKSLNAFQFDHPELHRFFADAAKWMKGDLANTIKGGEIQSAPGVLSDSVTPSMHDRYWRTSRQTSEPIAQLLDSGMSYARIEKALDAIISDRGQENYADAKRVELVLDGMLSDGYKDELGRHLPGIPEYVAAKSKIAGSLDVEQEPDPGVMGRETERLYGKPDAGTQSPLSDSAVRQPGPDVKSDDSLGSARAGFSTPGFQGEQKTSRMENSHGWNSVQKEATGLSEEDYHKIFRYESLKEGRSMALAEELLYVMSGGKKTFLKDYSPDDYKAMTDSLRDATAWNGPQQDAANLIYMELLQRSVEGRSTQEEYTEWLEVMREHQTAGGQGVQAIAKWNRTDNDTGKQSEMEAAAILRKSGLSNDEQGEILSRIVKLDGRINAIEDGDTGTMKAAILDAARQRGVLKSGVRGKLLERFADGLLDRMSFPQLKQFAFASSAAMASDLSPVDIGQIVKTWQVLSLLSNKTTVTRNLAGNAVFYGLDALTMDGAAILDMALSNMTGTRSVAMGRGPIDGSVWQDAFRAAALSTAEVLFDVDMDGGASRYGTHSNRTFKASGNLRTRIGPHGAVDVRTGKNGFGSAAVRLLSALERNQALYLTVPDEFFKGMARGAADRTQNLMDSGRIKTDNPAYAAEQADAMAKYRTFQDDSRFSEAIQTIHDVCNMVLGFGDSGKRSSKGRVIHSFGLGDFVSAFTRVAGNLGSRVIEYSPLNALRGTLEILDVLNDARNGRRSGTGVDPAKQARAVSDTARGLSGTAMILTFALLIKMGLIRLASDEDNKDVAALNRAEGLSGYQLNTSAAMRMMDGGTSEWRSGDTLMDFSSIQPIDGMAYTAAVMADDRPWYDAIIDAAADGAFSSIGNLPVMETAGNIGKRVLRYGEDIKDVAAEEAGRTLANSVIPGNIRALAKGLDDRPRDTSVDLDRYPDDGSVERFFKIMTDAAKLQGTASIPKVRERLNSSVSPIGQDRVYPTDPLWNLMNSVVNPVGVNTYTQSEQSQEWQRLREETGRTDFYPSASVKKTLEGTNDKTGEKTSKEMTYQERQELQRKRGFWLMPTVMEVMGSRNYQSYDAERQADLMKDAESFANSAAKAQTLGKDYVDKWISKTLEAQEKTGLPPGTVLIYRDLKNRGDGMKNEQLRKLIQADPSMSAAQKNALDDLLLTDVRVIYQDKDVDYSSDESFALSQMSDSAQQHWEYVRDKTGVSLQDYQTAWNICNRSEKGYHKEDRINDLMDQLGISRPEANRIWKAVNKDLDD